MERSREERRPTHTSRVERIGAEPSGAEKSGGQRTPSFVVAVGHWWSHMEKERSEFENGWFQFEMSLMIPAAMSDQL